MKEVLVSAKTTVEVKDTPMPSPGPHDILVKVVIAGTNPKDWKFPTVKGTHNSGDDLAGFVEAVGSEVKGFRKGDRVAGMHKFPDPNGAFAEFAILPDFMTFQIPDKTSFEEAATLPLAMLTASFGLFYTLNLPAPWSRPPASRIPLLIYGASSAVGAFAIKFAKAAEIHPIIAIGSPNSHFIQGYLDKDKGDALIDYHAHKDHGSLRQAIKEALVKADAPDGRALHAFDTVCGPGTFDEVLSKVVAGPPVAGKRPKVAVVSSDLEYSKFDETVDHEWTFCGRAHQGDQHEKMFAAATFGAMKEGLEDGWMKGHPFEVVPGGLDSVEKVLRMNREGKVRGKKLLLKVSDAGGASVPDPSNPYGIRDEEAALGALAS